MRLVGPQAPRSQNKRLKVLHGIVLASHDELLVVSRRRAAHMGIPIVHAHSRHHRQPMLDPIQAHHRAKLTRTRELMLGADSPGDEKSSYHWVSEGRSEEVD